MSLSQAGVYARALQAGELAAAKIWGDPMADLIGENKRRFSKVSVSGLRKPEAIEKKKVSNGGDDGVRTRDLRRDRPAF